MLRRLGLHDTKFFAADHDMGLLCVHEGDTNLIIGVLAQACWFAGLGDLASPLHGTTPINARPEFYISPRQCQETLMD